MAFTRHGHQVANTPVDPQDSRRKVARCGGPSICTQCAIDSTRAQAEYQQFLKTYNLGVPIMEEADVPDPFEEKTVFARKQVSSDIEAKRVYLSNMEVIANWCGGEVQGGSDDQYSIIKVPTLRGVMDAEVGDWVIRSISNGQFSQMDDATFRNYYN